MALGGAAWRNETRAWRRAMLETPRPNTGQFDKDSKYVILVQIGECLGALTFRPLL